MSFACGLWQKNTTEYIHVEYLEHHAKICQRPLCTYFIIKTVMMLAVLGTKTTEISIDNTHIHTYVCMYVCILVYISVYAKESLSLFSINTFWYTHKVQFPANSESDYIRNS
jgi:hypothetical protein